MDPLTLIGKIIDATAKVGAAFALAALAIFFLRNWHIEPFAGLDATLFQHVVVCGVAGFCVVLVEAILIAWKSAVWSARRIVTWWAASQAKKRRREQSLENLRAGGEGIDKLIYLKNSNKKRFLANQNEKIIRHLERSLLIEIDDINYNINSPCAWYKVPKHVWDVL